MTNGVRTKLVFHFYAGEDYPDNVFYTVHLKCLEKYINNFDEAVFVVTYDNGNENIALEARKAIGALGFRGELTIKMRENTLYREAVTFKEEVVDSDFEGLTFFGHTKGITNVYIDDIDIRDVFQWVFGMYYVNLDAFSEICENLIKFSAFAHGYLPLKSEADCPYSKYHWAFMGSFQWINMPLLKEYVRNNGIEMPVLNSRFYAETFLGNLIPCETKGAFIPIVSNVNTVSIVKGPRNYFHRHREMAMEELDFETVSNIDKLYNEVFKK